MLKGLFPRLFGNFREGGIVHAKFTQTAGPVYTLNSNQGSANYLLTLVNTGTGLYTLTVPGGFRNVAVLACLHVNIAAPGTPASYLKFYPLIITPGVGTITLTSLNSAATEIAANPANTDQVHVSLYVDK